MYSFWAGRFNTIYAVLYRYAPYVYIAMVAAWLLPIWMNSYFVTLDGPCHLYNANVLRYMALHQHSDLFNRFYQYNPDYTPNWFSHTLLAGLLTICNPATAEKILLTVYVISLTGFTWLLVNCINPKNRLLSFLIFPLVYTYVLQKGFYNFSFGLVFMIALVWFHFTYRQRIRTWLFICTEALLFLAIYFVHPFGYLLAAGVLSCATLITGISTKQNTTTWLRHLFKQAMELALAILPSAAMLLYFITRHSSEEAAPNPQTAADLWQVLSHLTGIVTLTSAEAPYAATIFWLFAGLLVAGVFIKLYNRNLSVHDSFMAMGLTLLLFYFKAPYGFAGGGMINQRLQILPFIVILFWFVSVSYPRAIIFVASLLTVAISVCLLAIRMPVYKQASAIAADYISAGQYIEPGSTVLPLNYNRYGTNNKGLPLTEGIWLFSHTTDYIGATKPLIMLGNYEAATTHFPLIWKPAADPFVHLNKNQGIEGTPPCVDIEQYGRSSGEKIDYVLLLHYKAQSATDPCTKELMSKLNGEYTLVYTSPTTITQLYKRNR